ncbi:nucleotidyltransferase family protein [Phenylobacterium immobile]|uniref:nucleotidyltransferase family protein n=1 Tax=Phenylobacterium immobile TaxID=21 RepID=UPI000B033BF8|nr:nucleotidyltransferase family protein [Phenylobacterium immobile]
MSVAAAAPRTAMVLAAGVGSRMRPLTDDRPKALVQVAGRALIDRVLDELVAAGVSRAVVNVHHFADQMEAHLAGRRDLEIVISDERAGLLDSGGGLAEARPLLGEDPIFVANIDSIWLAAGEAPLQTLVRAWRPEAMDLLMLLVERGQGIGFDGPAGFFKDDANRLTHSTGADAITPFANTGFGILKPQILDGAPAGAFAIQPIWRRLQAEGRLHGVVMDAFWMHVGDPAARDAAEAKLLEASRP